MPAQTIFIDGLPPVSVHRPRSWPSPYADDAWGFAVSHALICPECLRAWAILSFPDEPQLSIAGAPCERHGGGTLFARYRFDPMLLDALPEHLLKRELVLTLKEFEP